jgi:hypothetical protein
MGVGEPDFAAPMNSGPTVRYEEGFAGWLTEDATGPANQWRGAVAKYRVPKLRNTCPADTSTLVSWVGIGAGEESSPFFQVGTNQPYGISKNSNIAAFTEFFRGGANKGTRLSEQPVHYDLDLRPGDAVFLAAMWKPGPEKAFMYIQNLRTNTKISIEPHGKESALYDGRRLHYIIAERPFLDGKQRSNQQDFGTLGVTGAAAFVSGKGPQALGAQGHRVRLEMQRAKGGHPVGQQMVSTSHISGNGLGFQGSWRHCHP